MPNGDRRVRRARRLCFVVLRLLVPLSLAACGVGGGNAAGPPPSGTPTMPYDASQSRTTTGAQAEESRALGDTTAIVPTGGVTMNVTDTATQAAAGAWQTYHSSRGGFTVEYPAGWHVDETTNADGSIATVFTPGAGGEGIDIDVRRGAPQVEADDIPNTRCRPVTVAGLSGTRCFDTISFSTAATLSGQGKTFTLSSGKHGDQATFDHMLNSFRLAA